MEVKRRQKGSSILRALAVLEGIVSSVRPIGAAELNETLDLPKPTLHRLCTMLEREGFLQRELDGRRFVPGQRLNRLALAVLAALPHRAERHAILQRLSIELGETCNLSIPDGSEMVYIDRVETHWPLRLQLQIGTHVPLHCTAAGKLFLSSLPAARRKRLIHSLPRQTLTIKTLTDEDHLERALKQTRTQGFGIDDEEFIEGMIAVAVPVNDDRGRLAAALAVHAPVQRMSLEEARGHVATLRKAAEELSALLGTASD